MISCAKWLSSATCSCIKRALTTGFKPSPADKPGFVLYETVEQLRHHSTPPAPCLPLLTPFQAWKQTQFRASLRTVKTAKGLDLAMREYENQNTVNIGDHFRRRKHAMLPATMEGAIAEAMVVTDVINALEHNSMQLVDPATDPALTDDQMHTMSIIKWRRRRMRGHKYQKRMRKNRYKSKP